VLEYNSKETNDSSLDLPESDKEEELQTNSKGYVTEGLIRGIDLSEINGYVDWNKIESAYQNGTISYVILRMAENYNSFNGNREFTLDTKFESYLSECNKRGIPYGVYVFSRAHDKEHVEKETSELIKYINERKVHNKKSL
jgi:hypothetical protein